METTLPPTDESGLSSILVDIFAIEVILYLGCFSYRCRVFRNQNDGNPNLKNISNQKAPLPTKHSAKDFEKTIDLKTLYQLLKTKVGGLSINLYDQQNQSFPKGRLWTRKSNTEPLVRVLAEWTAKSNARKHLFQAENQRVALLRWAKKVFA